MELWFIYAVTSAVFAGLHTFVQKVAVERGYSSALISMWSTVISAVLAFLVSWVFFDFGGAWKMGILLGFAGGLTHMIGTVFRMDALKHIDTAVLFPLYKTVGPIFALIGGIILFSESFNTNEWIGIAFGITVPLMLLHKSEESRQNNLWKGVLFLLIAAFFTAVAAAIAKYGTGVFDSIFLFIAVSHAFGALSAWGIYELQKNNAKRNGGQFAHEYTHVGMFVLASLTGLTQFAGFSFLMLAFKSGSLGVVYTINSLYILVPIVLSIIYYKEHWNARKVAAIVLSIAALWFLQ